jgi:hypothetical protein
MHATLVQLAVWRAPQVGSSLLYTPSISKYLSLLIFFLQLYFSYWINYVSTIYFVCYIYFSIVGILSLTYPFMYLQ